MVLNLKVAFHVSQCRIFKIRDLSHYKVFFLVIKLKSVSKRMEEIVHWRRMRLKVYISAIVSAAALIKL